MVTGKAKIPIQKLNSTEGLFFMISFGVICGQYWALL